MISLVARARSRRAEPQQDDDNDNPSTAPVARSWVAPGQVGNMRFSGGTGLRLGIAIVIVIALFILINSSVRLIDTGHVGVVTQYGAVTGEVLQPGLHFLTPFITGVEDYDVRVAKETVEASAATKDLQAVNATLALNFLPDVQNIVEIHKSLGKNYKETIVDPAVQEAYKAASAQYTATESIERRPELKATTEKNLTASLERSHIIVYGVSIVDLQFSDEFNQAIEQKQVAQQQVEREKQILLQREVQAQQLEAQAQGEANAALIAAQAEASSIISITLALNPSYIQYQATNKWDGKVPVYNGGGAPLPFIDVTGVGAAAPTPTVAPAPAAPTPAAP